MNKQQLEALLKPLIKIYDDIEIDIIKNILMRLDSYNGISGSLDWYMDKLADLKVFDKDNLNVIKSNKKQIKEILENILESAGMNLNDFDRLNSFYEEGLLAINPEDVFDSVSINNLIVEALKDTEDIMNLIDTKAIEGANATYKNILNKAYIETASGVYTYDESIRRALKQMAKEGIDIVHYESGKKYSIESVVRRDVITRVNKLVGDVEIQHAKDLNTNLVYVDQHLGARVRTKYTKHDYEAHAEWQGKKYMIEGSNEKYDNLYEKTGYGEMLGLKGINCYHDMRPTFEWEEIPELIDLEENKKMNILLSEQRRYEKTLRRLKREKIIAKEQGYEDILKKNKESYSNVNNEYKQFLDKNNLNRNYSREYVHKIKTVSKNNYIDVTEDWLKNATPNSHEVKDMEYFETEDGTRYYVDGKNVVLDYSKEEKDIANWLEETFGGELNMVPRVNNPEGISTPDYMFRNEGWDLKTINGAGKQTLYHAIYKKKNQSKNFIFDASNSKLEIDELKKQIYKLYDREDTEFLQKIILKKNQNSFVYKRK